MGEDQGQVGSAVGDGEQSPEQIRHEIEETREQLGETAAALAAKTDVKARAKEKVDGVKQTISEKKDSFGSSPGPGGNGRDAAGAKAQANTVVAQVRSAVEANPIPSAAIAALVCGFLLGRLTSSD